MYNNIIMSSRDTEAEVIILCVRKEDAVAVTNSKHHAKHHTMRNSVM